MIYWAGSGEQEEICAAIFAQTLCTLRLSDKR